MNKSYNTKNKFLKNIMFGSFLLGSFAGTFSQLQATSNSIYEAVENNDTCTTSTLIKKQREIVNKKDSLGNTPLHYANTAAMINLLCKNGAKVNEPGYMGDTPLHNTLTVYPPNLECIEALLKQGAQIDIQNKKKETPLSIVQQAIKTSKAYRSLLVDSDVRETYTRILRLFHQAFPKFSPETEPDN
jgi:hypothetical protein